MIEWLKRLKDWINRPTPAPPFDPERRDRVLVDDTHIRLMDHKGRVRAIRRDELAEVLVYDNEGGYWGINWWCTLKDTSGTKLHIAEGVAGSGALNDVFKTLPGFDFDLMKAAAARKDRGPFVCWRKPASGQAD